jgi:hypothetical protein
MLTKLYCDTRNPNEVFFFLCCSFFTIVCPIDIIKEIDSPMTLSFFKQARLLNYMLYCHRLLQLSYVILHNICLWWEITVIGCHRCLSNIILLLLFIHNWDISPSKLLGCPRNLCNLNSKILLLTNLAKPTSKKF